MDGSHTPEEVVVAEQEATTVQSTKPTKDPILQPPKPSFLKNEEGAGKTTWAAILGFLTIIGGAMGVLQDNSNKTPPEFLKNPSISGKPTDNEIFNQGIIKGIDDDITSTNEKILAEAEQRTKNLHDQTTKE